MNKKIIFTLGKTLNELNLSRNKIAVESKVRPLTIRDMVNNETKSVRIDTLESILSALQRLANRKITLDDVFVYEEE